MKRTVMDRIVKFLIAGVLITPIGGFFLLSAIYDPAGSPGRNGLVPGLALFVVRLGILGFVGIHVMCVGKNEDAVAGLAKPPTLRKELPTFMAKKAGSLGELISFHENNPRPTYYILAVGFFLLLGFGVLVFLSDVFGDKEKWMFLLLMGIPVAGLTVVLVWTFFVLRFRKIAVFTEGMLMADGSSVDVYRWDEVRAGNLNLHNEYWEGTVTGLLRPDGERIPLEFRDVNDARFLGEAVWKETFLDAVHQLQQMFEENGECWFGDLGLNRRGLLLGRESLEWDQLQAVIIESPDAFYRIENRHGRWTVDRCEWPKGILGEEAMQTLLIWRKSIKSLHYKGLNYLAPNADYYIRLRDIPDLHAFLFFLEKLLGGFRRVRSEPVKWLEYADLLLNFLK
jgi:hypothetical protein